MEWAIEECKKTDLPVCASMCIGPDGDMHGWWRRVFQSFKRPVDIYIFLGVSASECAIRMARAGAEIGKNKDFHRTLIVDERFSFELHFSWYQLSFWPFCVTWMCSEDESWIGCSRQRAYKRRISTNQTWYLVPYSSFPFLSFLGMR